jgi:transcriptional regulator with XRE-family HTH domain
MPALLKDKLRSLRISKKLSLDKLATQAGVSKSYLWELENRDGVSPSAEKLARIASELDVTPEFLLDPKYEEPDEGTTREAFFRKFDRLDRSTQRKVEDIIERWSLPDSENT